MIDLVLSDVIDRLSCPICGAGLARAASSLRCPAGHTFDIARQGYVNLLPGGARPATADTPDMVRARADFLGAGHFAPLAGRLAELAAAELPAGSCVLDAGVGTGYYLSEVLRRAPDAVGLALDVSTHALRRAVREHARLGGAVCDLWRPIPVRTGAVDVILNVFAPRNGAEYRRMLRPGGLLLVVTPTPEHLAELVGPLGLVTVDGRKRERVEVALGEHFTAAAEERWEMVMGLSRREVETLVGMGPSARHLEAGELRARLGALPDPTQVTASCTVSVFRPQ